MTESRDGKAERATAGGRNAGGDLRAEIAALSFEEALAELERIVKSLEDGRQKLEEALKAYERGTLLRKHCEAKLAEVENRIEVIVASEDGTPVGTRPFGADEGSDPPTPRSS